jgi:chromosome segregation ATPase
MAEPIVTMTARVEVDKQKVLEDSVAVFKDAQKIADGNAIVYKFEGDKESLDKIIREIKNTDLKIGADIYIKSSAQDLQKLINEKFGQSAKIGAEIEVNADTSKAQEQLKKFDKEREKAQKGSRDSSNVASVRDLAMQQEIIDAQKKYKASVEETTKAIVEQTNVERNLGQYARRVPMTSEEAFQQFGRELDKINTKTHEFEKSLKKALDATKSSDSAGSSLDLLGKIQQQANKTGTEMNKEAAQAYNELRTRAKEYYDLLRQESAETITPTAHKRLEQLKQDWADATAAVGKYKTVAGSAASVKSLEKARSSFNESDDVVAVKYSQKLAENEKKLWELAKSGKYTSELTERLEDIAKKIGEINKNPIDLKVEGTVEKLGEIDKAVTKAFDDAKIADFRKAHESSIAKLNLQIEEFMQKNSKMGAEFKRQFENLKLDWDTEHTNQELEELVAKFAKLKGEVTAAGKLGASFFDTLRQRAMGVNAQLIAQYLSWQDIIRYIRTAAQAVIELDSALTEMRKVSDESLSSLKGYQNLTFDIAGDIGTTGLELQRATADWMRLGESMEDASESAKASTVLMNVSEFENINDATQALVSASQAYKELDKMDIVDVINNIGNNYAVATDELAQGLQNSAAVLKTQGNDLYEAVALLTAGNAITQDISKVAAGTRTIALRLAGTEEAKDELIQLGEDVDDMIVGTRAKMQGLIKDYTAVASNAYEGIDILDANGNLRDTYDILLDIAKVYQEIIDEDKKAGTNRAQALVEAIAGKNRSNIAASILLNPDLLESAYKTAKDSAGSAQEELDKYLESLEGHLKEFNNATQEFFYTLIDSGMLGDIIDFGTAFIKILTEIIDKLGTIPSLGLGIGVRQLMLHFDKIPELSGKVAEVIGGLAKASAEAQKAVTFDNATEATQEVLLNLEGLEGVFGRVVEETKEMSPATEAALRNISKLEGSFSPIGDAAEEVVESTAEIGSAAGNASVGGVAKLASAFKALVPILTNPITIMGALAVATYALYKWVDEANDRQREKIEGLQKEFDGLDKQLKSTNSELTNVEKQIAEIQGKGTISLVEQQELDRLRTQAELLKIARMEQEELLKLKAQELTSENAKLFNNVYGDINANKISNPEERIQGYNQMVGNQVKFSYGEQLSSALESAAKGDYNDSPNELLAIFQQIQEAREGALKTIEEYGSKVTKLNEEELAAFEGAKEVIADTDQYMSGLQIQIGKIKTELLNMKDSAGRAGTDEGDALVEQINSALKLVYQYSDTGREWNAMQIGSIFDNSELEKTRQELEAMAAAGELSESTLSQYPKLRDAISQLDLILGNGETAFSLFKNELLATAEAAKQANEELNNAQESVKSWASERDAALAKLGMASESNGEVTYDESWTKYLETIKQLNPELANNQEELEKCALANMQFSKAVDDLAKNFKTYKEALQDANQLTPEFSNAITALADDLTYLTGVNFFIEDAADFLGTADNLELLEKAINGSDEALQRLQQRAAEAIHISVDFSELEQLEEYTQVRIALGLETEAFNADIQNLANWINDNQNMGEIDVAAMLDANPFLKVLGEIMAESSEVAQAVKAMFNSLGWDVDWKMTKMKVITDQAWSGQKNDKVHVSSTYGPGGASQVNWVEKEVEVPTNIRYVPNGGSGGKTSTSKYTPKSISPAQKSNAGSNLSKGSGGGGSSSDKDTKEQEDTYKELIDYFERMIKVLDQSINLLKAHLEDVVGSFAKNTLIDAQEAQIKKKMEGYSSAISMYSAKASEALSKIPGDVAANIQNGAVAIGEFVGESNKEVVEAAQEYEGWADKVAECKQQIVELREELRQLELQKFKNVAQDFQELFDVRKTQIDLISKAIDLFSTARDKIVGRAFYDESIEQTEKQLNNLLEKRSALTNQMTSAMANGIDVASEEWLEMVAAIEEVNGAILDSQKSIEEYKNAIIQLYVDAFDTSAKRYSNQISIRQQTIDALENEIALVEAAGNVANRNYYDEMIKQKTKSIADLQTERQSLLSKMTDAMNNGVKVGTDEWYAMEQAIYNVDTAIQQANLSVQQYKKSIISAYKELFDREAKRYQNQLSIGEMANSAIEKQISIIEASGNLVGKAFLDTQLEQTRTQISTLMEEREALMARMSDATANGVKVASDEWMEMVQALNSVDSALQDATQSVEELDNALLTLHTASFERIQSRFSSLSSEMSNMADMYTDFDVATDDNQWTKEGLAQLGLAAQQYELAKKNVANYNAEIEELNKQYAAGKYSVTEYTEKLADLKSKQWDSVKASESAKKSIQELNKARVEIAVKAIEKETDAYKKLIQAQKDALSAEKDYHDYQKSLEESTKAVTDIERQLAALSDDDSLSAIAKRKKLEEELSEARKSLAEEEYAHSIEAQQNALDEQQTAYEEARQVEIETLQKSLEDVDALLTASFNAVRDNATLIGEELLTKAQTLNITMSPEITAPWEAGENAIAAYSDLFTTQSSAFMQTLSNVEQSEYAVQEQADKSSVSIALMFANQAAELCRQIEAANLELKQSQADADEGSKKVSDLFSQQSGNLVAQIKAAYLEMEALERDSQNASSAIAAAFGNRADALVTTIENARTSAYNLAKMSDALATSLHNSIDGSYSGGSAVSALDSIAGAANDVATAARDAAQALKELGMARQNSSSSSHVTTVYGGPDGRSRQVDWTGSGTNIESYSYNRRYATGTKGVSKDEVAWTQEQGPEMIVSPTTGAILTPLKKGDSVLPTDQTANIWNWSKFDPTEFARKLIQSAPSVGGTVQANTMQVGSLVTVNGPVNDTMEMMKIAATTASTKIKQSFNELSNGLNK